MTNKNDIKYLVSEEELIAVAVSKDVKGCLKFKKPVQPLDRDEVRDEILEIMAGFDADMDDDGGFYIEGRETISQFLDALSKLNIPERQFNEDNIREKIKTFLKDNIREALFDVLPFEDLIKELSQLSVKPGGDAVKLLEDIRHELVTLDNMTATDKEITPHLDSNLFFKVDVSKTIERIDKWLEKVK